MKDCQTTKIYLKKLLKFKNMKKIKGIKMGIWFLRLVTRKSWKDCILTWNPFC